MRGVWTDQQQRRYTESHRRALSSDELQPSIRISPPILQPYRLQLLHFLRAAVLHLLALLALALARCPAFLILIVGAPAIVHVSQVDAAVELGLAEARVDEVVQVAEVEGGRAAGRGLRR